MKGGYAMVDCAGLDLTKGEESQTIAGLYNRAKTAFESNKPVFAFNCVWGTRGIVSPIQVFGVDWGQAVGMIFTTSTLQIRVTPDDGVIITNMVSAN